jgi:hypothetical protein
MNMMTPTSNLKTTFSEFTAMEYLMIDVASNFGLSKKNWDTRINWTQDNMDELMEISMMTDVKDTLVKEAKEPALFYAGIMALAAARQGKPTGYPISLDATASGMQLLSVLIGCEKSAAICNVIPSTEFSDDREDAYVNLYNIMCTKVDNPADVSAEDAKDSIMTALYGSQAVPKQHFGEGSMLEAFYATLQEALPGVWSLNCLLKQLWQDDALSHDWIMPDNFHVHIKEMNKIQKQVRFMDKPATVDITVNQGSIEGRSLGANVTHSVDGLVVREMRGRCDYDINTVMNLFQLCSRAEGGEEFEGTASRAKDEMVNTLWQNYELYGFLSVRILDNLDEQNFCLVDYEVLRDLLVSLPDVPFKILTIHDCFRCLPSYGNDLRRQYNQILSDISSSKMLSYITTQITGQYIPVTKTSDLSADILQSDYSLS